MISFTRVRSALGPVALVAALATTLSPLGLSPLTRAQSAVYSGVNVLASGNISGPWGVTADSKGNIFVCTNGQQVYEILAGTSGAPAGVIESTSTVVSIGSGFDFPAAAAVDANGNVFVADHGNNAIKEILAGTGGAAAGTVNATSTVISVGTGFSAPYGVAVDASGNVYVADYGNNVVKEILAGTGGAAAGTVNSTSTVSVIGSGFILPVSVAVDPADNVFVMDDGDSSAKEIMAGTGGAGAGTVNANSTVNIIGSGFNNAQGLAVDLHDNVFVADTPNNSIREILAGTYSATNSGITLLSGLSSPEGVGVDPFGNLYVADTGQGAVTQVQLPAARFGSLNVGSTTSSLFVPFNFTASTTLSSINVLTAGASGKDYAQAATDTTCNTTTAYAAGDTCVVAVTFTPKFPGQRFGSVVLTANSGPAGTALLAGSGIAPQLTFSTLSSASPTTFIPSATNTFGSGFSRPYDVAVDASGDIFVADQNNNAVKEIVASGGVISASSPIVTVGSGFTGPEGVAVDASGDVFASDGHSNLIREILAGTGGAAPGTVNSTSSVISVGSGFNAPIGIAVDAFGNVFVADTYNNAVKEIVAGTGGAASGTVNSSSTVVSVGSQFNLPNGVAVDAEGDVFVADTGNGAVKEIVAGTGGAPAGTVNSTSTVTVIATGLGSPTFVAIDAAGDLFITSSVNSSVTEVVAVNGQVSSSSPSYSLGSGFAQPVGLALDGSGNVYISDTATNLLYEMTFATPPSLTFPATSVGATSLAQTVQIANNGNAALDMETPTASGTYNPTIPAGFTYASGSTCTQVGSTMSPFALASDATCTLQIAFAPTTAGTVTGSAVLTDNALNAAAPNFTTQSIPLSGTATAPVVLSTTTTLSANPTSATAGASVTLTATVKDQNSNPVTSGTVTFNSGSTTLGTGTLNSSGQATYTTTTLPVGSDSVTATFAATTTDAASTSSPITVTITAAAAQNFTLSAASTSLSTTYGQSATTTLKLVSTGGFTGAVNLACSGLAPGYSCAFNPSAPTLTANGTQTSTLTVEVPAAAAVRPSRTSASSFLPADSTGRLAALLAMLGLMLAAIRFRRRLSLAALRGLLVLALLLAGIGSMTACSTNPLGITSPNNIQNFTVTASSGSISQTVSIKLTVQ